LGHASRRFSGQTIVLIDERTMSQAEHLAMALRIVTRASVVGRPSAGDDGDVTSTCVLNRVCVSFSGSRVYWPDGRPLSGVGIVPDTLVFESIDAISKRQDEVLDAAVQLATCALHTGRNSGRGGSSPCAKVRIGGQTRRGQLN